MRATDFEYDGIKLSNMGYMICDFNSGGMQTISGSQLTFNTVSQLKGTKFSLTDTVYESCIETTFHICKSICLSNDVMVISIDEYRKLERWLNRKRFYKFKILDKEFVDLYFEGSFNISRLEINGKIYGLELTFHSNRPFAIHETVTIELNNTSGKGTFSITDISDEEGYIYPKVEISCLDIGNVEIHNAKEDRSTIIKKCTTGEIISMQYPIIKSSLVSHSVSLQNDFNFSFFRIASDYYSNVNDVTISLPCKMKIEYNPIIKVGL